MSIRTKLQGQIDAANAAFTSVLSGGSFDVQQPVTLYADSCGAILRLIDAANEYRNAVEKYHRGDVSTRHLANAEAEFERAAAAIDEERGAA